MRTARGALYHSRHEETDGNGGRGMSAVRKRGNRNGCIFRKGRTYYLRWMVDGVTLKRSLHTGDRREAEAEAERILAAYRARDRAEVLANVTARLDGAKAELAQIEATNPALRLADVFAAYRVNPNRPQSGEATLSRYEAQTARLVSWMAAHYPAAVEVRHVTRPMAAAFLADVARAFSANTYNKYASLLRLIWRTVGRAARCTSNPWEGVRRKVQPKTNGRRALTVEELRRVCAPLAGEMRLLFALGLYTGLRLGDCALLDWGAVDMVRRVIVTVPRKTARTGREVEIPLHGELYALLAETPEAARRGCVLPQTAETYRRDDSALSKTIRAVFGRAGIETRGKVEGYAHAVAKVGFHSLRHSFVSLMGNAGAPLALVQSIVGHSNPMMTAHYFHAQTDALAHAVAALPDVTGAGPAKKAIGARGGAEGMDTSAESAEGAGGRFRAATAILDGMDADGLRRLAAEIERRLKA